MRTLSAIVLLFLAAAFPILAADAPAMTPIFNGKDLTGWKAPTPNPWWTAVDGVLVGQNDPAKKGNVLETEKTYRDVVVEAEVRWNGEIDSGIFLRKGQKLQCQIGVSRSLKKDMTCSIYNGTYKGHEGQGVDKVLKVGDWNKIRFQAKGSVFTIWLNGEQVLNWESPDYPDAGPVGLQIHGGVEMKVEFRNLQVAEL